jgi:hypothetical protein
MHYSLDKLETIPETARQQLAAFDIHNTDDLLSRAAMPRDRERLAEKTQLSSEALAHWAGIADLLRIKGIGPSYAELLMQSGLVGNVQQFLGTLGAEKPVHVEGTRRIAEKEHVHAAASELVQQLSMFAIKNSIDRRLPSVRNLAEAAEEAAELRPRLVLASPDDGREFRQHVLKQAREAWRYSWKHILATMGILAGFCVTALIVLFVAMSGKLDRISTDGDILTELSAQLVGTATNYLWRSGAVLIAMLCVILLVFFVIYDILTYAMNTQLLTRLLGAPPYRALYWKVTSLSLERQKRAGWWSLPVFVVIVLGLLLYFYFTLDEFHQAYEDFLPRYLQRLALPMTIGGVLAGVVICIPGLRFYLRELRIDPAVDGAGVQRYLIFRLAHVILIPVMIMVIVHFTLPRLFQAHAYVYRTYIVPRLEADILEIRAAVTAIELDDESTQERREQLLLEFDQMVTDNLADYGLIVTEENQEILDFGIALALNVVVWMLFTGIALLLVLPYLVLGGWGRGLLYMFILFAAFVIENELQKSAPAWFSLRRGTASSWLIVAFAVFANALFLDWLFESLSERKKVCPGCHTQLEEHDLHCSVCGLMQP